MSVMGIKAKVAGRAKKPAPAKASIGKIIQANERTVPSGMMIPMVAIRLLAGGLSIFANRKRPVTNANKMKSKIVTAINVMVIKEVDVA